MKHYLVMMLVVAGALVNSSCIKSTSSSDYDSSWRPYSGTTWEQPSSINNFVATDGGFSFDVTISSANAVDTLGVVLPFVPSMYLISNIETAASAEFAITATVSSQKDSMLLATPPTDPAASKYAFFQFGRVHGTVSTMGKDSVLTTPRAFGQDGLFTYAPSVQPDSCSKKISLKIVANWNAYTGPAVADTLTTTTISVQVKNMALTVSGIAILK